MPHDASVAVRAPDESSPTETDPTRVSRGLQGVPLDEDALETLRAMIKADGMQAVCVRLGRARTSIGHAAAGGGMRRDPRDALTQQLRALKEAAGR